ncbi:hypothetical protein PFICI_00708 [Pestalotiopsis fici W106-1]|uniref:EKC/KEOPS complex subunit BUD32 n=1 Tax=Pestalotiopsis fici (strain W106-1 / CGMCC3.15140) TaxID=1229662 RepID=W3XLM7_PESFW|nr:uncharacterized protein PFICI_00708 [Pestalotiopsis fici W106-1]ETS86880.1 hypothetical protein PFICI_00708 [Pestalotiopsis fici W106-1]
MSRENVFKSLSIRSKKTSNQLDIKGLGSLLDGSYDEDATPIREHTWSHQENCISTKDHQPQGESINNNEEAANSAAMEVTGQQTTKEAIVNEEAAEGVTESEKGVGHDSTSSAHPDEGTASVTGEEWEPVDPFSYEENVNDYLYGGFYPVEIGDKIISRYEVFHKLGNGGHGTVWLVHDLELIKWRALKILSAPQSSEDGPDRRFLRLMRDKGITAEDLEKRRIVFPCEDPFEIDNPDGRKNLCLVMPLMGPDLISIRQWEPAMMRRIFYELAESLEFLHQRNICHGDFRPSNLLLCLDQDDLHTISKEEMRSILERPHTQDVDYAIWWEHYPRLPRYIVQKADTSWLGIKFTGQAAVVDFGCAYDVTDSSAYAGIPPMWAAPEAYWNLGSGLPGDIWALATTIAQVYAGTDIFYGHQHDDAVVAEYEFVLGALPQPYRTAYYNQLKQAILYDYRGKQASNTIEESRVPDTVANMSAATDATVSIDIKELPEPISMTQESLAKDRKYYCNKHSQPTVIRALISRPWLMEMRDPEFPYHEHNADNHYDLLRAYPDITIERRLIPREVKILGDLLEGILRYRPEARLSISDVLQHEWFGYQEERWASFDDDVVKNPTAKYDGASKRYGRGIDAEKVHAAKGPRNNNKHGSKHWAKEGRSQRQKQPGRSMEAKIQISRPLRDILVDIVTIDGLLKQNMSLLLGIVLATALWLPMAVAFYLNERQRQRQAIPIDISFHQGSLL